MWAWTLHREGTLRCNKLRDWANRALLSVSRWCFTVNSPLRCHVVLSLFVQMNWLWFLMEEWCFCCHSEQLVDFYCFCMDLKCIRFCLWNLLLYHILSICFFDSHDKVEIIAFLDGAKIIGIDAEHYYFIISCCICACFTNHYLTAFPFPFNWCKILTALRHCNLLQLQVSKKKTANR